MIETEQEQLEAQAMRNLKVLKHRRILREHITPEVLNVIKEQFSYHLPCYQRGSNGEYSPIEAALRDGAHEVIKWLEMETRATKPEQE